MDQSNDQILRDLKQLSNQARLLSINVNEMRDNVMELHTDNLQKDYQIEKLKAEIERLKKDNAEMLREIIGFKERGFFSYGPIGF